MIELNKEYNLSPKVKIIWMLNTVFSALGLMILLVILGFLSSYFIGPISLIADTFVLLMIIGMLVVLIIHYIYIELKWRNFKYMFTDHNLVIQYGIIRKRIERIPYVKIQNIAIRYDIIHRFLGVGQVIISTAATDIKLSEFSLDAIEDPEPFVDEAIRRIEGFQNRKSKNRVLKD
ncbi:MAG: PH domain-containing protein [Candidatus Micrarchaeota archaeon]|nr:PH domain-containing protein [Candidatus Micrarchaeota archaeon]